MERGTRVEWAVLEWRRGASMQDAADSWAVTPEEIHSEFRSCYPEEAAQQDKVVARAASFAKALAPFAFLYYGVKRWM